MNQHKINNLHLIEHSPEKENAVIFIHAFPMTNRMWDLQVHELKNYYRIITYDLRCFGQSTYDKTVTIDTHVDDLTDIIDTLKLTRPAVCGLSMGGYVLLRALELNEELFKCAVLSDTKSENDTNDSKLKRFAQIKQISNGGKDEFIDGFLKAALSENTIENKKEVYNFLKEMVRKQDDKSITDALLILASRTDTTESLSKLNLDTLVVVGEKDNLTPVTYSRAMYQRIKNAQLEIIPDSSHFPNLENKPVFNKVLLNFFNKCFSKETK